MPRALNRRNRSVHLAVILILAAIVYGFLVYHPESDRDAENFSTQDLQIKHHLTTPTPIVQSIESLQPSHKAIRTKHAHELQPIETPSPVVSVPDQKYSNQTVVPSSDRTCARPYRVKQGDSISFITHTQNVATVDLLAENGLRFPFESTLAPGSIICLPNTCHIVHIVGADKCYLFAPTGIVQPEILAWNPHAAKGLESGPLCFDLGPSGEVAFCMSKPGKVE
ncbi:hypothetical protein CLAFUW4_08875 [Fulvia fulva]|uniref:LysM domain-containing protein n=1 Tax=Passalora fulva TaxID=5499 RepID=A0A9Q8PFE4_PASFU|nr:uncharacterized protein CLAFUR5_08981 [Fulvia fulva]KAK4613396.1 hypothetical protein CLAFUR4_08881 [Fulvia fulva]KAK4614634.1 hypothetical protein CLAFUR0_08873 [Fulvia fulva]UJO21584.1 hypothetical protein CLAFUR5_08981 [Fulvia fulva]WPV19787.1 hypothetical protein CLAFUW4_08875 [Fulvia fulva]WPV35472.1 hypothetical protein CLAFUW7_08876 [Fulvia fulva]